MLRWELEWGSSLKLLLEVKEQTGQTPRALANRPLPRADCTKYRKIFHILSSQREFGEHGAQPIQVAQIVSYCFGVGVADEEEREKIIDFVISMDGVFRDHVNKVKEQTKSSTPSNT